MGTLCVGTRHKEIDMETTPKGIENLTDDERRVTRIDEAKQIWPHLGYFLIPNGWLWNNEKGGFRKTIGGKDRTKRQFRICINGARKPHYISVLIDRLFRTLE